MPQQLLSGHFKGYAHETHGTAAIYDINGKRVLRLTNFKTSNGPDVHVYLVAAPDATDDDTVKNTPFVDLGIMKGNVGDQNYDVPQSLDLESIGLPRSGANALPLTLEQLRLLRRMSDIDGLPTIFRAGLQPAEP